MNFDYIQDVEPETEELRKLFSSIYTHLTEAENCYWSRPQECGRMLQETAEEICQIYNAFYQIGFTEKDLLEDYLCYTGEDEHNVMVSRFLSVVRQSQRDRLEWLRVWGDECIFFEEHPEEIEANQDKLYLNVKKMMNYILETTREMCEKLYGMEGLKELSFQEQILPGYVSPDEMEEREEKARQKAKAEKKGFFSRLKKKGM